MERTSRRPGLRLTKASGAGSRTIQSAPTRAGHEPERTGLPAWLHLLALAGAVLAGILVFPIVSRGAPATGTVAPDFALKDLGGANQRLSEFRGDVVVLTFWASWCGPCRETLADLQTVQAGEPAERPILLSVNIEGDPVRAASVVRSLGVGYDTLLDTRQAVGRLYDVSHLPLTLLLDRDGVVRGAWSRNHVSADELLAGIRELQRQ
ncbi:MAG TPA: TlpA disulfide reductase family protein [Steroidobacteraceae bacterium]